MSDQPGGKQMSSFLNKKGAYLCELAVTHSIGSEHEKAKALYIQAASWFKKAGSTDKMNEAIQMAKEEEAKMQ